MDEMWEWLTRLDREHETREAEFMRLLADSPKRVLVGDRVVVAAGLTGRGYNWVRVEAEVLEVGDVSVKVRFLGREALVGKPDEDWIHSALITDILRRPNIPPSGETSPNILGEKENRDGTTVG